jgi:hypothetical protein
MEIHLLVKHLFRDGFLKRAGQTVPPEQVFPRTEAFREMSQHLVSDVQRFFHFLYVTHV